MKNLLTVLHLAIFHISKHNQKYKYFIDYFIITSDKGTSQGVNSDFNETLYIYSLHKKINLKNISCGKKTV